MSSTHHEVVLSDPPVEGAVVRGYTTGPAIGGGTYKTEFFGTYRGVKVSDWSALDVHVIEDGQVGGVPQDVFHLPVWPVHATAARIRGEES